MEFSLSSDNGKPCVIFQNKQFFPTSNINVGSRVVFKCSDVKCLSRIVIQGNEIVKRYHKHTCDDNVNWIESSELSEISRRTRTKSLKTYEEKQLVDDYNSFFDDDSSSPRPVPSTRKKKRKYYVFKGDSRRSKDKPPKVRKIQTFMDRYGTDKYGKGTKYMDLVERKLFYDLIEENYLALTGAVKERAGCWETILQKFNESIKVPRTLAQLRKFWGNVKLKLKRQIIVGGLKTIYSLPPHELRPLSLMPASFFREVCPETELTACILEAIKLNKDSTDMGIEQDIDEADFNEVENMVNVGDCDDDSYYSEGDEEMEEEENPLEVSTVDSSSMDEQFNSIKKPNNVTMENNVPNSSSRRKQDLTSTLKNSNGEEEMFTDSDENLSLDDTPNVHVTEIDLSQVEPAEQLEKCSSIQISSVETINNRVETKINGDLMDKQESHNDNSNSRAMSPPYPVTSPPYPITSPPYPVDNHPSKVMSPPYPVDTHSSRVTSPPYPVDNQSSRATSPPYPVDENPIIFNSLDSIASLPTIMNVQSLTNAQFSSAVSATDISNSNCNNFVKILPKPRKSNIARKKTTKMKNLKPPNAINIQNSPLASYLIEPTSPPYPIKPTSPPYPIKPTSPPYPIKPTSPPYPIGPTSPPYPIKPTSPPYPIKNGPPSYPIKSNSQLHKTNPINTTSQQLKIKDTTSTYPIKATPQHFITKGNDSRYSIMTLPNSMSSFPTTSSVTHPSFPLNASPFSVSYPTVPQSYPINAMNTPSPYIINSATQQQPYPINSVGQSPFVFNSQSSTQSNLPNQRNSEEYFSFSKDYIYRRMSMEQTKFQYKMENLKKERENLTERHQLEMNVLQLKLKYVTAQYEDMLRKSKN